MTVRWQRVYRRSGRGASVLALILLFMSSMAAWAASAPEPTDRVAVSERANHARGAIEVAQAEDDAEAAQESRPLEPRYQPREPEKKPWYNGSYIFGMTRGVANSTIAPAGKAPLFVLTVPLDIVCLPFAVIGGFFG